MQAHRLQNLLHRVLTSFRLKKYFCQLFSPSKRNEVVVRVPEKVIRAGVTWCTGLPPLPSLHFYSSLKGHFQIADAPPSSVLQPRKLTFEINVPT